MNCAGSPPQVIDIALVADEFSRLRKALAEGDGWIEIESRQGFPLILDIKSVLYVYLLSNSYTTTHGTIEIE